MLVDRIRPTEMDDVIRAFPATRTMRVLELPTGDVPYLLLMSFGFDEESTPCFTFGGGPDGRKREPAEATDRAGFPCAAESSASTEGDNPSSVAGSL